MAWSSWLPPLPGVWSETGEVAPGAQAEKRPMWGLRKALLGGGKEDSQCRFYFFLVHPDHPSAAHCAMYLGTESCPIFPTDMFCSESSVYQGKLPALTFFTSVTMNSFFISVIQVRLCCSHMPRERQTHHALKFFQPLPRTAQAHWSGAGRL